ncbi:hypothetical protein [Thiomonas sp.]
MLREHIQKLQTVRKKNGENHAGERKLAIVTKISPKTGFPEESCKKCNHCQRPSLAKRKETLDRLVAEAQAHGEYE